HAPPPQICTLSLHDALPICPALQFSLGILAQGAQATLSYRVRLGVGAQGGSGVNSAQAVSGSLASNRASAAVQVVGGVFDSKARSEEHTSELQSRVDLVCRL